MNELTDGQIENIYLDHRDQLPNIPLIRAVIAADRARRQADLSAWQNSPTIDNADAIRAQRQDEQEPATDGWKLVPLEPTAEMLQAGQDTPVSESDEDALEDYKVVYRAMLAAAPHPQQIAGLDKDAEIATLKAELDALKQDAERKHQLCHKQAPFQ